MRTTYTPRLLNHGCSRRARSSPPLHALSLGVADSWLHGERVYKDSSVGCDADPTIAAPGKGLWAVKRETKKVVVSEPPRAWLLGHDILGRCVLCLRW
jgi:hypothetical protein